MTLICFSYVYRLDSTVRYEADSLKECVSSRAKEVIGLPTVSLDLVPGETADLVLFDKSFSKLRSRKSIPEVVYDPIPGRLTIRNGRITNR